MTKVDLHEVKSNFPELVDKTLKGEEVIFVRDGKPIVRLVPMNKKKRPIGLHVTQLSDEEASKAIEPLSNEELGFYADKTL